MGSSGFSQTTTTIGNDFWVAFPPNYDPDELVLFISTESDSNVNGVVVSTDGTFNESFVVAPGIVTTVTIPSRFMLGDAVENKGIRVTAESTIAVYGINRRQYTTDAFLAIPTSSLGTDYRVTSNEVSDAALSVVATEDGTTVTITDSNSATSTVNLNKGQTYFKTGNFTSGARVQSNKPIVVYGSNKCTNIGECGACDHIVQQMFPISSWGVNFVTVPTAGRNDSGDYFKVLASKDNTEITINGSSVGTINAGEYYSATLTTYSTITTSKVVMVTQFALGYSCSGSQGDPFMMVIPPREQFLTDYTIVTLSGFDSQFINIVSPSNALGTIKLDGITIPNSSFTQIGTSAYYGARIPVSVGSHTVNSPIPFGAFVYGWTGYDSYGYPGGGSLSSLGTVNNVTISPEMVSGVLNNDYVCFTANVTDFDGNPVADILVDFKVSGLNNVDGVATTDENGDATYCYNQTGTTAGEDQIYAEVVGIQSTISTINWTVEGGNLSPTITNIENQSIYSCNSSNLTVDFTIGDAETSANSLTVTASSSNTTVLPNANIDITGSGENRSMDITPVSGEFGVTDITLSVEDEDGNIVSTTFTLTVSDGDNVAPNVPEIPDLVENCSATPLSPTTTDDCTGEIIGTTTTTFPITTEGLTVVVWSFDDGNGNISTANQNVTVYADATAPDMPILEDVIGCTSITPTAPTTNDDCAGVVTGTTTTTFPITTIGTTVVTWTFDDGNGHSITANQNIILGEESDPPYAPTISDAIGECSVTPTTPTAIDACSGEIIGTTTTVFPITSIGTTVVIWSFDDGSGNITTANQNVIVNNDNTAPIAPVLTEMRSCSSITPPTPSALDECSGVNIDGTTTTTFPVSAIGTTTVTWTFTDGSGNSSTSTQDIIIVDGTTEPPVTPVIEDIVTECSANPDAPTTTDGCGNETIIGTTTTTFPITAITTTIVTWTFTDANSNSITAEQLITITPDATAPVAPVLGDLTGNSPYTPPIPNATDACEGTIVGTTTTTFPITSGGDVVVTWIFDDGNGNISTVDQNITVISDTTPPVTPTIADANGECSITPEAPTTTDDQSGVVTGTTTTTFPIATQGTTVVTWTFTDDAGNSTTADQNVILNDVTPPDVIVQNITVQLDANGEATITADQINNVSTDNCSVDTYELDITSFDCSNIGENTVRLTVTDVNGNSNFNDAIVTIEDNIKPNVIVQNITVQLDANGEATIASTDIDNGSTDNCTIETSVLDITSFDCSNIGENTVRLTVTDVSGNSDFKDATVTVEDNINPNVIVQNITVQLDNNGEATIVSADIDNGSTDNCSIATYVLDKTSFGCSNVGNKG